MLLPRKGRKQKMNQIMETEIKQARNENRSLATETDYDREGKKEDHQRSTKHLFIIIGAACNFLPPGDSAKDSLGFTTQIEKPNRESKI